jgi:1-acyl-sn-glycerol-3-phosphate acyltransferase
VDKRKVIYYTDELHDEFSVAVITPKKIDENYQYCHDSLWKRLTHFFWYRMIFTPIAYGYTKIKFHHTVVGREKFRSCRHDGYFLYGNHTQDIGDAFIPNMLNIPKENYVIVHPNNVSMPFLGRITPSLGALPLPDDMKAYRNFLKAVERRIAENHAVVIYPEAHIWPYYTGIRPFTEDSFYYPVKCGAPVYCFTNTYQKRRFSEKPNIVTYIDGPFYPDEHLPQRERRKALRDRVYQVMCERAKKSTVIQIEYRKREETNG